MTTRILPIGKFCKIGSGGTPSRSMLNEYYGGSIPWVKSGELRENEIFDTEEHITERALRESSAKIVPKGAVLLAMYGATVGRTAILGVDAATNQAVCSIIPDDTICDTSYLIYSLRAKLPELLALRVGGAQPNISQTIIKSTLIPLPPLPAQKHIAQILNKADELKSKRLQYRELIETLTVSIFLGLFGDPVTNPKGWAKKPISDISSMIGSGLTPRGGSAVYLPEGILFIRSQNVLMNNLDLSDAVFISQSIHESMGRSSVKNGDILFNITGASIGRVHHYQGRDDQANVNQHVCIIRPKQSEVLTEFLSYQLSIPSYQSMIMSRNAGATRQAFNYQQIRAFQIIVPPVEIQKQFCEAISKIAVMLSDFQKSAELVAQLNDALSRKFLTTEGSKSLAYV